MIDHEVKDKYPLVVDPKKIKRIEKQICIIIDTMGLPEKQDATVKKLVHKAVWERMDTWYRVYDAKAEKALYKSRKRHKKRMARSLQ